MPAILSAPLTSTQSLSLYTSFSDLYVDRDGAGDGGEGWWRGGGEYI